MISVACLGVAVYVGVNEMKAEFRSADEARAAALLEEEAQVRLAAEEKAKAEALADAASLAAQQEADRLQAECDKRKPVEKDVTVGGSPKFVTSDVAEVDADLTIDCGALPVVDRFPQVESGADGSTPGGGYAYDHLEVVPKPNKKPPPKAEPGLKITIIGN